MHLAEGIHAVRLSARPLLGLVILSLLSGCLRKPEMDSEEAAAAQALQRAGGKLQTESIPSKEFSECVRALDFTDVPICDADLAPASRLPFLRSVALRGTKVTDAGLAFFKDRQYIENVDLSRSRITGSGLNALRFGRVKELNLAESKFDDRGLAELIGMGQHLQRLNLAATAVTDDGLESLSSLRTLESVDLSRTRITGTGLRYLPIGLRELNLSGAKIGNAHLSHLERFNSLEVLNLSDTQTTDDAIPHIQAMAEAQNSKVGRRRFKDLNLQKTLVTDRAIESLLKATPGLRIQR